MAAICSVSARVPGRGLPLLAALVICSTAVAESRPTDASPVQPVTNALAGNYLAQGADPRLRRKVTLELVGGTLGGYAERLAEHSKVSHTVRAPFADYALLALNVDLTLADLQRAVADTYGLTWSASRDSSPAYTLSESADDRKQRRNLLALTRRRGREEMVRRLERVREMAFLSPEELDRLAEAGDWKALSLKHPRGGGTSRLVFRLPDAVWQRFWATGTARVTIASLPPAVQELSKEAAAPHIDPAVVVDRGWIGMRFGGTVDRPTIWLRFRYGNEGMDGNLLYREGMTRQPPEDRRRAAEANPTKPPPDPRFRQTVTLRDQGISRAGNRGIFVERGERWPNAKPLAVLLEDLAAQVDMPVLAECELVLKDGKPDPVWLRQQWWLAAELVDEPLPRALDMLCADFEMEWRFRNGVLLIRPRLWFVPPKDREYQHLQADSFG